MGKAEEVANRVRNALAAGRFPAGAMLPSVRDLALQFRINPNTIVRAFQILTEEGLVVAEERRGYFAARGNLAKARASLANTAGRSLERAVREALSVPLTAQEIRSRVEKALTESIRHSA